MSKLKDYKDLIRELAELLDKSTLSEIEVEENDFRIRVARETAETVSYAVPAPAPVAAAPAAVAAPAAPAAAPAPENAGGDPADHPGAVTAPMVGTAYAASQPGAAPFVAVGQKVAEGDTIAIIEAMKVMNQIPATKSGTVTQVLYSDAQPVEFGEPLCIIE